MVIRAQHAPRFLAAGIETAIELLAGVLFHGSEGYELVHKTEGSWIRWCEIRTPRAIPPLVAKKLMELAESGETCK